MTALIAAALEQQVDSMAELVRNGAKVDRQNGAGLTAAAVAAMAGKPASLTQLCALGADMNFENKNAQTPLTLACKYAESTRAPYPTLIAEREDVMGAVDRLAELGAAVDFETKAGHTALGVAAAAGAHNTCAHLIDMGACVDRVSAKGMSALMLAACAQQTKVIDALLSAGANGNLIASPAIGDDVPATLRGFVKSPSFTALNLAAQLGAVHSIATLVQGGSSPNLENKQGYTPLQLALENNQVDAVEALLKGGADAEFVNGNGETSLMTCAKRAEMTPGIIALLNAGAKPDTESSKLKTTALMVAAAAGVDVNIAALATGRERCTVHGARCTHWFFFFSFVCIRISLDFKAASSTEAHARGVYSRTVVARGSETDTHEGFY